MENAKALVCDDIRKVEDCLKKVFKPANIVHEEIDSFLNGTSKRIRSILALLYLKANRIELTQDIIKILVSGEIIHNASLLHDDVIDKADMRRGKSTIYSKFNSDISILSGDFLLTQATKLLLKIDRHEKVLNIFLECAEQMENAEIQQYMLRGKVPEIHDYIDICKGKTASLFSAILQCIAIIGKADIAAAKFLGENFGILFQIKNDMNENSVKIDKKNGIYTAIDIIGIEKTNILTDNYLENIRKLTEDFPEKVYKDAIKLLAEEEI